MSSKHKSRNHREAMKGPSESSGRANNNGAASLLTVSGWNSIAGVQQYNEKLIEIAQSNINMTLDFFRQTAAAKSPSEFITVLTEHARRQYETSSEQAKQFAGLAQSLTRF